MIGTVQAIALLMVATFGTVVVLVHDPRRQVVALAPFSLSLIVLMTVLHAPDVVLSGIVVGMFAYPTLVLLTLAKGARPPR